MMIVESKSTMANLVYSEYERDGSAIQKPMEALADIEKNVSSNNTMESYRSDRQMHCPLSFGDKFRILLYIVGALLTIFDVSSDCLLAYEYYESWIYYKMFGSVPEKSPLGAYELNYFILTLTWVLLGAVCQTCILISQIRNKEKKQHLNLKIKNQLLTLTKLYLILAIILQKRIKAILRG